MNENQNNENLVAYIQEQLDASLDNIDASTQSLITQARYRALDQQAPLNFLPWSLPVGVVTTACLALVILSLVPETDVMDATAIDEFELISNIDDLELLEDLEFYEWLEDYELPT